MGSSRPVPGRLEPLMPAPDSETTSGEATAPPSSPTDAKPQAAPTTASPFRAAWPWVLCVIGLDYLSTLAYQPSIAFGAAGRLAPLVTVLVAGLTVFFALPIYWYV